MQPFRKLIVWQKGHELALNLYKTTKTFQLMASDLGLLDKECYLPLERSVTQVKRMLTGLIRRLMTDNR